MIAPKTQLHMNRKFRTRTQACLAAAFLAVVAIGTAQAQNYPEVIFILDGSGSMLGQAGSEVKIDAAKAVMEKVVPGLNPNVKMGLIAYGHRRKGDCSDIEVLIPPGSTDRDALLAKVRAITPRGKTPISDAVLTAAGLLKSKENETTIILVSDGIETCVADPCAVVRQLKATGIKFVLHVVGFGVDTKAKSQLDCMADAGGGRYFDAGDKDALLEALKTVEEEVVEKVQAAASSKAAAGSGLPKLVIKLPASASPPIGGIYITKEEGKTKVLETDELPPTSTYTVAPGAYKVTYLLKGEFNRVTPASMGHFELKMGETREVQLGAVTFNVAKNVEGAAVDQVILADAGSGEHSVTVNCGAQMHWAFDPKAALPGVYDVLFHYSGSPDKPSPVARSVTVSPLKETEITLNTSFTFKETNSAIKGWDLVPIDTGIIANNEEDGDKALSAEPVVRARPKGVNTYSLWSPYVVPPGRYAVRVHVRGADEPLVVAPDLSIKAGEALEFDSGL